LREKKVYLSEEEAIGLYGRLRESANEDHEMSHVLINRFNRRPKSHSKLTK
jgi:hypothetical protein